MACYKDMAKITINKHRCKGCLLCISACNKGLISVEQDLNAQGIRPVKFKNSDTCLGCMMCAVICPDCCIEVFR